MTVIRRKDSKTPRVIMHRVADIRGGVSVKTSELSGDYLAEGSVLSAPDNGICHVLKIAVVYENAANNATQIKVKKNHHFKVEDVVSLGVGVKAVAITAISESNSAYDLITVAETLGVALSAGDQLVQAAEASLEGYYACESTDEGALKVVTADAAEGQILKGSVTPWRGEGSSPNANTYVVYKAANSALKHAPLAISGTGKPIDPKSNMDMDAWLMAVTKDNPLPACVGNALKGIINY